MKNKTYCGLDLASVSHNQTGLTVLSAEKGKPKVIFIGHLKTDEEITETINKYKPAITAIDAPFSIGQTSFRECESQLIDLGYKLLPPSFLISLIKRVQELKPKLNGKLIEVHPSISKKALRFHQAEKSLFINDAQILIDGIEDRDYSAHEVDSIIGAYTAYLFDNEKACVYGGTEGEIVVPNSKYFKLVVFDLDGTITKPVSSWEHIHRHLGTWDIGQRNLREFLSNQINYMEFAKADAKPWIGTKAAKLDEIIDIIEYNPGMEELLTGLKSYNAKIAIISGGLKILADKVAKQFGLQYIFANDLLYTDNKINGKVKVVVDYNGKDKVYDKLLKQLRLKPYEVLTIGDSSGDIPLFQKSGLSIAFNPIEKKVSEKAHITVKSGLEIIDYLGLNKSLVNS